MAFVCIDDYEEKAITLLEKNALDYYKSGAGEQYSLTQNREAFKRLRIRPRFLRNVSHLDTSCSILGCRLDWPVGIAPTAMQKMAHADGEAGNARAAGTVGSIFILSTLSTTSIEEVALTAPLTCKWFQLYIYKDRSLTEQLIRRAEKSNFKAIVLTIDAPIFGQRRLDVRNKFKLPSQYRLANFQGVQSNGIISKDSSGINEYVSTQFDDTVTWRDVAWLKNFTQLPIVLKGILTKEDALLAKEFGCKGVIVSNHGARQLDGVPASIEALPEVARAVGEDILVMMDGGIRQGNDILKAMALGAKYVFIGRPALWGLACNGQKGVEDILKILRHDFQIALALSGCRSLRDINKNMVSHERAYGKL